MVSKRPFKITSQEIAALFWGVGLFIVMITFYMSYNQQYNVFIVDMSMILFFAIGVFFFFIGFAFPCYQISKWDCNIFIDRLEPGWDGWLRFTKSRKFAPQCVQTGPLGQEKGLVSGHKADIINRGDFPITLRNGNHAVIKYDLMSHNINLNEGIGWKLMVRKHGLLGMNAYRRCLVDGGTIKQNTDGFLSRSKKKKTEEASK